MTVGTSPNLHSLPYPLTIPTQELNPLGIQSMMSILKAHPLIYQYMKKVIIPSLGAVMTMLEIMKLAMFLWSI